MEPLHQSLLDGADPSDQLQPAHASGDAASVSVDAEPFNEDDPFDGTDERDIWPRCAPLPPLTSAQVRDLAARAPHHLWQTQSLLLALLLASYFTLLALYATMRIVSAITPEDDLFKGAHTSLSSRARYFGLPALASMLLSLLCYLGFRGVWKKKTWRVMREAEGTAAMLRSIRQAICGRKQRKRGTAGGERSRAARTGPQHQQQQQQQSPPQQPPPSQVGQYRSSGYAIPVQSAPFLAYSSLGAAHSASVANTPAFATPHLYPPQSGHDSGLALRYRESDADLHHTNRSHSQSFAGVVGASSGFDPDALLGSQPVYHANESERMGLAGDEPEHEYDDDNDENSVHLHPIVHNHHAPSSIFFFPGSSSPYEAPSRGSDGSPGPDPTPSLAEDNHVTYKHAFDAPPLAHPYFFSSSSLLRPSDVCLLRQHPSWNHWIWSQCYMYWLLLLVPFMLFGIAVVIFNSPDLHAAALSFFLSASTFLVAQLSKLLAHVPSLCFGGRVGSSSWGVQFRLNLYVSLLAIMCPMIILVSHAVVIMFGGFAKQNVAEERLALDALFDSIWITYLLCVASDEAFLTLRAVWRLREMRKMAARAKAKAKAVAAGEAHADADGPDATQQGESSVMSRVRSSLLSYNLEGELKLCLYSVLFPISTSNLNPSILLVALPCVLVVVIGFKLRYDLFNSMLNEHEENVQLVQAGVGTGRAGAVGTGAGAGAGAGREPHLRMFRRGSDLLSFGSMLSVLYQATQWVMVGGFLVFMLLNVDELLAGLRPNNSSSSTSSSSTGAAHFAASSAWSSFSATGAAFGGGDGNVTATAAETAAAAAEVWAHGARRLFEAGVAAASSGALTLDELERAHSFGDPYGSQYLPSIQSGGFGGGSTSTGGGGGGGVTTPAWMGSAIAWSSLLFALWLARSLYFLCAHRVKAVRTAPWQRDEKHLPPSLRAAAAAAAARTGPLEEYLTMELNPDKVSAIACAMARRTTRNNLAWRLCWWLVLQISTLLVGMLVFASIFGLFFSFYYACASLFCTASDLSPDPSTPVSQRCASTCYSSHVLMTAFQISMLLAPLPLLLLFFPLSFLCARAGHAVNQSFLGAVQPYPGKFYASPCWLCYKRSQLSRAARRQRKERKLQLQRMDSQGRAWEQQWRTEETARRRRQIIGIDSDDGTGAAAASAASAFLAYSTPDMAAFHHDAAFYSAR